MERTSDRRGSMSWRHHRAAAGGGGMPRPSSKRMRWRGPASPVTLSRLAPVLFVALLLPGNTPWTSSHGSAPVSALSAHLAAALSGLAEAYQHLAAPGPRTGATVTGSFWQNYSVAGGTLANTSSMYCDRVLPWVLLLPAGLDPQHPPVTGRPGRVCLRELHQRHHEQLRARPGEHHGGPGRVLSLLGWWTDLRGPRRCREHHLPVLPGARAIVLGQLLGGH